MSVSTAYGQCISTRSTHFICLRLNAQYVLLELFVDALNAAIHDDLREPFGKIIKRASYAMALAFSAILNAIVDRCNTMNHLGLARIESIEPSQADDIAVLIRRAYRKRKYEDIMRLGAFSPSFSSWLLL